MTTTELDGRTTQTVADYDNLIYKLHASSLIAYRLGLEQISKEAEDLLERVRCARAEGKKPPVFAGWSNE